MEFDSYGCAKSVGKEVNKFCNFIASIARNPMYLPLNISSWDRVEFYLIKRAWCMIRVCISKTFDLLLIHILCKIQTTHTCLSIL